MKNESPWRTAARKHIVKVIDVVGRDDMKKLRRALCSAYPFGEKRWWPYKVWLSEIKRQLAPPPPLDDTPMQLFE